MSAIYAASATQIPLPLRKRLLASYLNGLVLNPLRTKALVLAISYYLQSLLSTYLAQPKSKASGTSLSRFIDGSPAEKIDQLSRAASGVKRGMMERKAVMMALYGLIISGPMKHYLPTLIARISARLVPTSAVSTPKKALVTQLLLSLGVQAPIEVAVYVASMAYIGGARTTQQIKGALSLGFKPVYAATLVLQPLTTAVCINYVSPEMWPVVGVLVQFVIGTAASTAVKTKRAKAAAQAAADKEK